MRKCFLVLACQAVLAAAIPTGPAVGETVPDFRLADQNGAFQTLHSIMGAKGAMLVFYRSADW